MRIMPYLITKSSDLSPLMIAVAILVAMLAHPARTIHCLCAFAEAIIALRKGNSEMAHYQLFNELGCLAPLAAVILGACVALVIQ